MKKLFLTICIAFATLFLFGQGTEKSRADLYSQVATDLASGQQIKISVLRQIINDLIASDYNVTDNNLINAQYSVKTSTWHDVYTGADRYVRFSSDDINWTQPVLILDGTTMDLDTNRIVNVANPILPLDAINKQSVDSLFEANKTALELESITDPAVNEATSTAIIDTSQGIVITLTTTGNDQILQPPTIKTDRSFIVVNDPLSQGNITVSTSIDGASHLIQPGTYNTFIYDSVSWSCNNITSTTTLNLNGTALFEGGILDTVTGDNNTFNIQAGDGIIIDNVTNHEKPQVTYVSWSAINNVSPSFLATQPRSYVGIDINGNPVQASFDFSNEQKRSIIELGSVIHIDNINVSDAINTPTIGFDRILMQSDMAKAIGNINTGNIYSGINATANIDKSSGSTFKEGANYVNNPLDPHDTDDPLEATVIFVYAWRDGAGKLNFAAPTSTVNGSNYDDGTGILATVPSNKFTNQRTFYFPTTERTFIAYGQNVYNSLTEAVLAASTETFDIPAIYTEGSSQRAVLSLRNNFSTFTDPVSDGTTYKITPLGKFGEISSGSIATSIDLQAAYNNSALPQITIAAGLPLQVKSGTGNDADNIFEGLNNAGSATFELNGNGKLSISEDLNVLTTGYYGSGYPNQLTIDGTSGRIGTNFYYDAGTPKRLFGSYATSLTFSDGLFKIFSAAWDNAGTTITWNETFNIDLGGNLITNGRMIIDNTTEATTTLNGSIQTDGGLSVVKDVVIGGTATAATATLGTHLMPLVQMTNGTEAISGSTIGAVNLTSGYIPYMTTSLVNSPIYTDGTNAALGTTSLSNLWQIQGNANGLITSSIRNISSGSSARATFSIGNDASSSVSQIEVFSSNWSSSGGGDDVPNGSRFFSSGSGGLSFRANAGTMRFYTGSTERLEIDETGLSSFSGDVDIAGKATADVYTTNEQALSGTTPTMDIESGSVATLTLTGNTTLTITNLPTGSINGRIEVVNGATPYTLDINGSTGYTTEVVMGVNATIDAIATNHTTVIFWRTGSTLYYGFIYDN